MLSILRTVAPFAVKIGKNILNGLLGGSLEGFDLQPLEGISGDEILTKEEAQTSQSLQGMENMKKSEVYQIEKVQANLNASIWLNPLENCKPEIYHCGAKYRYNFNPATTDTTKDETTGIITIGSDDHIYIHLCPVMMNNFNKMLDAYETFYLQEVDVSVRDISNTTNPIIIRFYPMTKVTKNITNGSVLNCNTGRNIEKELS